MKSYAAAHLPELEVTIHESIDALLAARPDVAGISTSTENLSIALEHVEKLQAARIPVLLGGIHITLMPQTLPRGVVGVMGEGEETLVELMRHFIAAGRFDPAAMGEIAGLTFHGPDGKRVQTAPRKLIEPLERIPFPDRAALGIQPGKEGWLYMFTSRGCPYACKFCVSRRHWSKYREFPAEYVIREIEHLVRDYRVRHIHFFDDLFIVNRKRMRAIADGLEARGIQVETSMAVRANLVDDELCLLLKRLNVSEVMFGAESFSEPVLKVLKASSVKVAQNHQALEVLQRHGIKANITMIFNAPEERREDLIVSWKAVFEAVRSRKLHKMAWGFLRPYPGCEYWEMARERGIVGDEMDWRVFRNWSDKRFHMNDHLPFDEVAEIVEEWQTKCYVANLDFLDGARRYPTLAALFEGQRAVVERICARAEKDDSDRFVEAEYHRFLAERDRRPQLALGRGWEEICEGTRWARREATFELSGPATERPGFLNVNFFVPDTRYYPDGRLTVTAELGAARNSLTVQQSGKHRLSVPIGGAAGARLLGRILCSQDFRPSVVSESGDTRPLSIVVESMELAQRNPGDVVERIDLAG
jgi:radical SAM superfamily enzyme YgiQ (UPF0313 family)